MITGDGPAWDAMAWGPPARPDDRGGWAVPFWGRRFCTGLCFHFALALLERLPAGEVVALGDPEAPDHAGVRPAPGHPLVLDVRGALGDAGFAASHPHLTAVPSSAAAAAAMAGLGGVVPPFRGVAEMLDARLAVARRFPRAPAPSGASRRVLAGRLAAEGRAIAPPAPPGAFA